MRYPTDGSAAVAALPLAVGDTVRLDVDPNPWTVTAVSAHFAAVTRPVTDRDREEIYAEYDAPDDCDGEGCAHLGCHSDPPNLEGDTIFYSVLDWRNGVRGPCDRIGQGWGDGTYTEAECAAMLAAFEAGQVRVSQRNWTALAVGQHHPVSGSRPAR